MGQNALGFACNCLALEVEALRGQMVIIKG